MEDGMDFFSERTKVSAYNPWLICDEFVFRSPKIGHLGIDSDPGGNPEKRDAVVEQNSQCPREYPVQHAVVPMCFPVVIELEAEHCRVI